MQETKVLLCNNAARKISKVLMKDIKNAYSKEILKTAYQTKEDIMIIEELVADKEKTYYESINKRIDLMK